ncbi:hypothetical protein O181_087175 [Austropuccinia psidii MF-1]|uniref:Uncharacterized protein n=1 Tax=Austropuccinia psidii MF-1 TaxID=1389203 RepID=A0A9Q3P1D8_9BASI|nr:hypothetical protein [Austropuccinia psidii MF-1]
MLQLLQQKYRSPELESQLEEPWLRDYKNNEYFLMDGLLYHREKHTSALTVVYRPNLSDPAGMPCLPLHGTQGEDRTEERVASTG